MPKTAVSLTPKDIEAYRRSAMQVKPKRQEAGAHHGMGSHYFQPAGDAIPCISLYTFDVEMA